MKIRFKGAMLNLLLNIAENLFLNKVKNTRWHSYMKNRFDDIEKAAKVLVDKNPNDTEQLNALWEERGGEFVSDNLEQAERIIDEKLISKIADEDLADYARNRLEDVKSIAKIVTDSDPDDAAQMRELWEQNGEVFVEDSVERLKDLIAKQFPDQATTANILLDGVLEIVQEKF